MSSRVSPPGSVSGVEDSTSDLKVPPLDSLATGKDVISHELFKAVVKVFSVSCAPSYSMPWTMSHQRTSYSSGFFIDAGGDSSQKWIMCNAHGVSHARQIRVRKHGEAKKYIAKVVHILHECDLALLTVADTRFWVDTLSLQLFRRLPDLQDTVLVVGYPVGGDNVCVTKGVVSRIGYGKYMHAQRSLLMVQVDSPINGGNSGGPVFLGSDVVGVAFQSYSTKQNIGYIIPFPVIQHFLESIERFGAPQDFVRLGVGWRKLESPAFKKKLRMKEDQSGVLVSHMTPLTDACKLIKRGDVILQLEGTQVADDGTVPFRTKGERVSFHYLYMTKFMGESIEFKILRDGVESTVSVECGSCNALVPLHLYDLPPQKPPYYVFGGVAFSVLSRPYLKAYYGSKWPSTAPLEMIRYCSEVMKEEEGQQVVVLSHVFSCDATLGYEIVMAPRVVLKINGEDIRNLAQVCVLLDECTTEFVTVEMHLEETAVVETEEMRKCLPEILGVHSIPKDRSDDMPKGRVVEVSEAKTDATPDSTEEEVSAAKDAVDAGGDVHMSDASVSSEETATDTVTAKPSASAEKTHAKGDAV